MIGLRTLFFFWLLVSMGGCASLSHPADVARIPNARRLVSESYRAAEIISPIEIPQVQRVVLVKQSSGILSWIPIDLRNESMDNQYPSLPIEWISERDGFGNGLDILIEDPAELGVASVPDSGRSSSNRSQGGPGSFGESILEDHSQFYSFPSLSKLGLGVALGAALANSHGDEGIRDSFIDNITQAGGGEYTEGFHQTKWVGDGYYTIPAFAGFVVAGWIVDDVPLLSTGGEWGERSLRTLLVGGPPMLVLQYTMGASRPNESGEQSEWQPFQDNNGVSGHAFMGAIPFLSAAKMTEDPYLKATFYVASTLPGLSRITDDDHYPSQVLLGWWIAYLAASAVDEVNISRSHVSIFPMMIPDGAGVGIEFRR